MSITIAQVRELLRAMSFSVHAGVRGAGGASSDIVKNSDIWAADAAMAGAVPVMTLQRDRVAALLTVVVESPI